MKLERRRIEHIALVTVSVLLILAVAVLAGLFIAGPPAEAAVTTPAPAPGARPRQGDAELAYLLTRLEIQTRRVMYGHYIREQSSLPGIDATWKRWLTKNLILPAAVADGIFSEIVPEATGGRAWVKMVVDEPRNPNNRGDEVSAELLAELRGGAAFAERNLPDAEYYAEPIKATVHCLRCHGEPAGAPDPSFPQYEKEGWKVDEIVGAVVSRVARAGTPRAK